ncbi:hypothetical protein MLD38_037765 [Melastoma candidum]|uniref:Uncharacterized protein n=1 Tax=Melastoma candidum TaxID=119954 RepID=A0ACB9LPL9_9MYRT|nr:hypothetical protein MLD38_037765 [Melastoma candidum]
MGSIAADSTVVLLQSIATTATILLVLAAFIKVVYFLWWNPLRVQRMMVGQGVLGPQYQLIFGNTRQASQMNIAALHKPLKLSDDVFQKVQPHIYTWTKAYGKNYISWQGPEPTLNISDTEMAKQVMNNKDDHFVKGKPTSFIKMMIGYGLVMADGENWVKQRNLANHAFHGESLKAMLPAMVDSVYLMLERWKGIKGNDVEVFEEFRILSSEVISRTAFGSSYEEGRNIFHMISQLATLTVRNFHTWRIPGLSLLWRMADEAEGYRLEKAIRAAILDVVQKREAQKNSGKMNGYGTDFLGLLLEANHEDDGSKKITINTLVDECKTFYFAGQETTNTLLGWTMFHLASHPYWQEEARKEVVDVFGDLDPNFVGVAKLRTMMMILNESLRLYSPITGLTRKVPKRTRIGDITVPANFQVTVANFKIHHDPDVWGEDAHVFKPERFSEGVAKATNNNMAAFLPFGLGPRMCVGNNFALMEAKVALAMILQRYRFSLSPGYIHCPYQHLTIQPLHGIQVILRPIE